MGKKYYAVRKGRQSGVYTTWNECKRQVIGYPKSEYKSFSVQSEARVYLAGVAKAYPKQFQQTPHIVQPKPAAADEFVYQLEYDGASKGNPGKAGAGALLRHPDGSVVQEMSIGLGLATNNFAEYQGLILGLRAALDRNITRIQVQGDSTLVCMQVAGDWAVKNEGLRPLHLEAQALTKQFAEFSIHHIDREYNAAADALANKGVNLPLRKVIIKPAKRVTSTINVESSVAEYAQSSGSAEIRDEAAAPKSLESAEGVMESEPNEQHDSQPMQITRSRKVKEVGGLMDSIDETAAVKSFQSVMELDPSKQHNSKKAKSTRGRKTKEEEAVIAGESKDVAPKRARTRKSKQLDIPLNEKLANAEVVSDQGDSPDDAGGMIYATTTKRKRGSENNSNTATMRISRTKKSLKVENVENSGEDGIEATSKDKESSTAITKPLRKKSVKVERVEIASEVEDTSKDKESSTAMTKPLRKKSVKVESAEIANEAVDATSKDKESSTAMRKNSVKVERVEIASEAVEATSKDKESSTAMTKPLRKKSVKVESVEIASEAVEATRKKSVKVESVEIASEAMEGAHEDLEKHATGEDVTEAVEATKKTRKAKGSCKLAAMVEISDPQENIEPTTKSRRGRTSKPGSTKEMSVTTGLNSMEGDLFVETTSSSTKRTRKSKEASKLVDAKGTSDANEVQGGLLGIERIGTETMRTTTVHAARRRSLGENIVPVRSSRQSSSLINVGDGFGLLAHRTSRNRTRISDRVASNSAMNLEVSCRSYHKLHGSEVRVQGSLTSMLKTPAQAAKHMGRFPAVKCISTMAVVIVVSLF